MIIGELIEIDNPECFTSEDCKNGGSCFQGICKCFQGFSGPNCQNSIGKIFDILYVRVISLIFQSEKLVNQIHVKEVYVLMEDVGAKNHTQEKNVSTVRVTLKDVGRHVKILDFVKRMEVILSVIVEQEQEECVVKSSISVS